MLLLQRDSDIDEEITQVIQPQIIAVGEVHKLDLLHIVVEGEILCSIKGQRLVDAVVALLATFYVFNITYTTCKGILAFLEETLLGLRRGPTQVNVVSFCNALHQGSTKTKIFASLNRQFYSPILNKPIVNSESDVVRSTAPDYQTSFCWGLEEVPICITMALNHFQRLSNCFGFSRANSI